MAFESEIVVSFFGFEIVNGDASLDGSVGESERLVSVFVFENGDAPELRGGFGMGFFLDPKSGIPNHGIFRKKFQKRNSEIFFPWDWDFFRGVGNPTKSHLCLSCCFSWVSKLCHSAGILSMR